MGRSIWIDGWNSKEITLQDNCQGSSHMKRMSLLDVYEVLLDVKIVLNNKDEVQMPIRTHIRI